MTGSNTLLFRIDDISINTRIDRLCTHFIDPIIDYTERVGLVPNFLFGMSPCVFDMSAETDSWQRERIFPKILNAHSDQTVFYSPERVGIPKIDVINSHIFTKTVNRFESAVNAMFCGHGMFHIDHRLISYEAQEINIMASHSIVMSACKVRQCNYVPKFIPPFNKFNDDTGKICRDNNIELVEWSEEKWKHLVYLNAPIDSSALDGFYFHTHDFSAKNQFIEKLNFIQP